MCSSQTLCVYYQLVSFLVAVVHANFKKKIQARDGHMLIIMELYGSLYLFGWLQYKLNFRKRYKLEIDSVEENNKEKWEGGKGKREKDKGEKIKE